MLLDRLVTAPEKAARPPADAEPGIIPRLTEALFHAKETDAKAETRVWVSYSEIYNETIRDLLHVSETHEELKVPRSSGFHEEF